MKKSLYYAKINLKIYEDMLVEAESSESSFTKKEVELIKTQIDVLKIFIKKHEEK